MVEFFLIFTTQYNENVPLLVQACIQKHASKEVIAIDEVRNKNKKRVCDISRDRRLIVIKIGDCPVRITANADGTFNIEGATIIPEAA